MRSIAKVLFELFSKFWIALKSILWILVKRKGTHTPKVFKNKKYKLSTFGGLSKMLFYSSHLVQFNKGFEYETLEKFIELLRPGYTVLDVGANIGLFSLIGSEVVGSTGKIYAFEPAKDTFAALEKNIEANNCENIQLFQLALSDNNGFAEMNSKTEGIQEGDLFNHLSLTDNEEKNDNSIVTQTLDSFLLEHKIERIDVIKIDIEGAELLCFNGAKSLLSSNDRPDIIFEVYEAYCNRFGNSSFDVLKFLNECGYEKMQPLGPFQWVAYANPPTYL